MKIPNKIKIGGFEWNVKQDRDVAYEGNMHGSTHHQTQTIFLDPNGTEQKKQQTFLHEVMHAIWWQAGLGKRFNEQPKIEEEIIDAISNGLYQVFRDNPSWNKR